MEVEFVSGSVYRYQDVPLEVAFRVAIGYPMGSIGRSFHRLVRSRGYRYKRL